MILRRIDGDLLRPAGAQQRIDARHRRPGPGRPQGNVVVANALGSGLLEARAAAFLPALARRLLGEELKMPSVATWWCGGTKERAPVWTTSIAW